MDNAISLLFCFDGEMKRNKKVVKLGYCFHFTSMLPLSRLVPPSIAQQKLFYLLDNINAALDRESPNFMTFARRKNIVE